MLADVCAKAGCWGVMVFPTSAKGKQAVAEGVFTKIEMTPEQARAEAKHMAEDRGERVNAKKTAPSVVYEIRGTGAVIK